jgi:hypothetical protein
MVNKHEGPVPLPYFSISEKVYINDALRMYKHISKGNDIDHIDTIAVVMSRDGVLYEFQFWILWRAVLFYKLNFPANPIYANSELVLSNIFDKMRGVIEKYGLDNDKGNKGAAQ